MTSVRLSPGIISLKFWNKSVAVYSLPGANLNPSSNPRKVTEGSAARTGSSHPAAMIAARHTASSRRHQLLFPVDRIISIAAASLDHQCAVCTHRNLVPGIAHGVAGLCLYGIRHDLRRQAVFAVLRPRNTGGLP